MIKEKDLSVHCAAHKLGFPYAIEFSNTYKGRTRFRYARQSCLDRLGSAATWFNDRTNHKAQWAAEQGSTYMRICFRTKNARALAMLMI